MSGWTCARCTFLNHELMENCEMCNAPKEFAEMPYLGDGDSENQTTDSRSMEQSPGPTADDKLREQTTSIPSTEMDQTDGKPLTDDALMDQTKPEQSADDMLSMDIEVIENPEELSVQANVGSASNSFQNREATPPTDSLTQNGRPEVPTLPAPIAPVVIHDQEKEDSPMSEPEHIDAAMCMSPDKAEEGGWSFLSNEVRLVLIGKTGVGKSTTGNNILDNKTFKSSASGSSITKKCQLGWASRFDKDIQVIDTPGLFDTGMSNEDITREVVKCIGMTSPGPHAFVLVIRLDRFTAEEKATVDHFINIFGKEMLKYMIVLFTRMDDLKFDGTTLEEYVQSVPPDLKNLLEVCQHRCIGFDNRGSEEERNKDVQSLLAMVERMVKQNGGGHYTNEMYEEAERIIAEQEEEHIRRNREEMNREMERLRQEVEEELKKKEEEKRREVEQMKGRMSELGIDEDDEDWVEILGTPSMSPIEGSAICFHPALNQVAPLNVEVVPVVNGTKSSSKSPEASKSLEKSKDDVAQASASTEQKSKSIEDGYSKAQGFGKTKTPTDSSQVTHPYNNNGNMANQNLSSLNKPAPKSDHDSGIQNRCDSNVSEHDVQVQELRERAQKMSHDHQKDRERMREEYYARQAEALERYNQKHKESRQRTREDMQNVHSGVFSRMFGAMKKFVKSITDPISRGFQSLFGTVQTRAENTNGESIF